MLPDISQPHEESKQTAPADQPLSTSRCLILLLVGLIPLAGPVILCVWSFSSRQSPAKRALARALLIVRIGLCLLFTTLVVQGTIHLSRWLAAYDYWSLPYSDDWDVYDYEQPDLPENWEYYFQPWGDLPENWDGKPLIPCDPSPLNTRNTEYDGGFTL